MKNNLWILTEERPKRSVIDAILTRYAADFNEFYARSPSFAIRPIVAEGQFTFRYAVEGVKLSGIGAVYIELVSGNSSFVDYMVARQPTRPNEHDMSHVLMAVEETKTGDGESRNSSIYQRASKFIYLDHFCPAAKKYMLFNEEMTPDAHRTPSDTNRFGTNMLLTLGVKFIGKTMHGFHPFSGVDELIEQKNAMRPPRSPQNVPIVLRKSTGTVTVSGRLDKPKGAGNIGHDPNIGALSCIGYTLRKLGWRGEITVTQHGVSQAYVDKTKGQNKCLLLFSMLGMTLEGIRLPPAVSFPPHYWNYACTSEKVASIFLHLTCMYGGINGVYENHAGCERSYFRTPSGELLALPKKDKQGENLLLPDVVLCDGAAGRIYNVEGKKLTTMHNGIAEVETYHAIEDEFIEPYYQPHEIQRWVCVFGGKAAGIPHEKVLLYLTEEGHVFINDNAPAGVKNAFQQIGIAC